jgi:NADH-quinone oxidoreductase subunit M
MLWLFQRAMFGPISEVNAQMKDLNAREIAYFLPLVAAAFWIGIYPRPVMAVLQAPVKKLVQQVNPDFYAQESLAEGQRVAAQFGAKAMNAPGPGSQEGGN